MLDTEAVDGSGSSFGLFHASTLPASEHPNVERLRRPLTFTRRVSLTEPALRVMTDFKHDSPVTVPSDLPIDAALQDMLVARVRALLVVRDDKIMGLITSYDIQGERPLQFIAASGYSRHDEIEVRHIMTPWKDVRKLDLEWVSHARVADVDNRFQRTTVTHIAVTETAGAQGPFVRGLFSRTHIGRQLGRLPP